MDPLQGEHTEILAGIGYGSEKMAFCLQKL